MNNIIYLSNTHWREAVGGRAPRSLREIDELCALSATVSESCQSTLNLTSSTHSLTLVLACMILSIFPLSFLGG